MDGKASSAHIYLEHMLLDETVKPTMLPLSLLEAITNNFSDDREIGRGGFAVVYKGMLGNDMVAVKKLSQTLDMDEKKFVQEVQCLMKARHKNIVRFLGYCADTQGEMTDYEGKSVLAEVRNRLLCFEFVPNGSLSELINDASCGLEWRVRYQIIKGICEGLHYLHKNRIVHLDLKPGNILLDGNMVPKIADFGLSRCFDENQSKAITSKLIGSVGYAAPEFYDGQITFKLDMYSLGIIVMEILTGKKGYSRVDKVLKSWRNRLEISQDTTLYQVQACVEIGIMCIDPNPENRPITQYIMDKLIELDNNYEFINDFDSVHNDVFSLNSFEDSHPKDYAAANKGRAVVNDSKKNQIQNSEPPLQPGDEMLREHEQQIQQARDRSNERYKEPALRSERQSTTKGHWLQNPGIGSGIRRIYKSMVRPNQIQEVEGLVVSSNTEDKARPRIMDMPKRVHGEHVAAGWPQWLTEVAPEAVHGWQPRRAESFEKLDKIGQGAHSIVYRGRDLENQKIVALKKVRFDSKDPESVKFMAREIHTLRRLDHPNVIKLEGLVTSYMSCSLYLVLEYMEHDLAGLAATPGLKFTEPQVKCYMQQLLSGLDHCHNRGVLHRDIKGANLLLDNNGILKIADFGLATFFNPNQKQHLTSRVVTLWHRPPELLLGATNYGAAVDLWSAGCILAELLSGKPIMPGRTEVEQLHKIFKLCGSPSEEFWANLKLSRATIFKPQHPYRRCVNDVYKDFPTTALTLLDHLLAVEPGNRGTAASALDSEFFTKKPYACDPSSLPKYRPSKEYDAKLQDEKARRQGAAAKRQGAEAGQRKQLPAPDGNGGLQVNPKSRSYKFTPKEEDVSGFPIDPPARAADNGYPQCVPLMQAGRSSSTLGTSSGMCSSQIVTAEMSNQSTASGQRGNAPKMSSSGYSQLTASDPSSSLQKDDVAANKEPAVVNGTKKNIYYSGQLMLSGVKLDEMLREHERQIQQVLRRARLDKGKGKHNGERDQSEAPLYNVKADHR